jgi:hypothetical protein
MKVSSQLHAPAPLYSRVDTPWYPLDRGGWVGSQTRIGRYGEEQNLFRLQELSNPGFSVIQPVVQSLYRLSCPGTHTGR